MPDIAMCTDMWCPSRGECYRYRAVPTPGWQTYQFFQRDSGKDRCGSFAVIHPTRDGRSLRTREEADAANQRAAGPDKDNP